MKSRLAITALLAVGALMSSGGAALGISALSTDLSAGAAQYGQPAQQAPGPQQVAGAPAGGGEVLGETAEGGSGPAGEEGVAGARDEGAVAGEQASSPAATAQAPRQVAAAQGDQLPFTGYAAIPLLLVGLALLASGLVLRRGSRGTLTQP